MRIETILIVVLLCLGAVQGVVYGMLFMFNKGPNRTANRLFAAILFFLSYRLSVQVLRLFGLGYYDTWYHFTLDLNWVYGPLIYLFVKAQVVPAFRLQRKDWLHFTPLVIQIVCSNFVRAQNFYWDGTRESLSWLGYWGYVVWMNYPTIYLIASLLIIAYALAAEKLLKQAVREGMVIPEQVLWIKRVILSFRIYFSLVVTILLVDLLVFDITFSGFYYYFERFYYYPLFVGVAVLTYWLGIAVFQKKDQRVLTAAALISREERDQMYQLGKRLDALIDRDSLHRDPDLNLSKVAEKLDVKPYLLSRCLKLQFEKNFNDYINEQRVATLIDLLRNPDNEQYTLLALAYEAGFNSKASFNRAVKKQLGISPRELKEKISEGHM